MTIDTRQHTNILIQILKDIFTDPTIGPFLGFKGGTAVFLLYGLTRLSVDLDFDLLDLNKEDYIFNRIKEILEHYGKVKEAQKKRYSLFFLLSYANKTTGAQNIKVEINKRNFGSRYELKQYLGIPMKVMVQEDMAAHKMVAMHERIGKANRDIFDVWFFLRNNWPINKKIIQERTNMTYKEFLRLVIKELENMNNRSILSGIGELLNEKQKVWVKASLLADTIFLLKLALSGE